MSFIKQLFEKRKEKKYGKGHKLGSLPTDNSSYQHQSISGAAALPPNERSMNARSQPTEASQMAGQAALMRLQQQQNPSRPKTAAAANQIANEMKSSLKLQEKEIEKAMDLKNHYFGDKKVF
jgi:hypothetical protein